MGSKYKAGCPDPGQDQRNMHGWRKAARKRRKRRRGDDSTIRTETSTLCSLDYEDKDDDDHDEDTTPPRLPPYPKIELRPMRSGGIPRLGTPSHHLPIGSSSIPYGSSQHALLQRQGSASASAPSSPPRSSHERGVTRSGSMPGIVSLVTTTGTSAPALPSDAHA